MPTRKEILFNSRTAYCTEYREQQQYISYSDLTIAIDVLHASRIGYAQSEGIEHGSRTADSGGLDAGSIVDGGDGQIVQRL